VDEVHRKLRISQRIIFVAIMYTHDSNEINTR